MSNVSRVQGCSGHQGHRGQSFQNSCANNGQKHKIEEVLRQIQQTLQLQQQAQTQQQTHHSQLQQQLRETQQELQKPSENEIANKSERIEQLVRDAKDSRGVDQGQALRELDQLTGAQAATNALLRSIV